MKWITREKVKIDRVACPWLIKRFIDTEAEFVFLTADTDWAGLKEGIVYDVPNSELGHHGEEVRSTRFSRNTVYPIQLSRCSLKSFGPPTLIRAIRTRPGRAFAGSHTASASSG